MIHYPRMNASGKAGQRGTCGFAHFISVKRVLENGQKMHFVGNRQRSMQPYYRAVAKTALKLPVTSI